MKRFFALIGFALAIAPVATVAQEQNLYELFREQTNREYAKEEFDELVIRFVQSVYEDEWNMSDDEIKAALNGNVMAACGTDDGTWAAEAHRSECGRALPNIKLLANEEQHLRAFGRDLQRMASAQELPLSEIPGRPFHMATDLSGIINIWRAGTGSVQKTASGILVRTRMLTDEEADLIREPFEQLANGLRAAAEEDSGENREMLNAAVWYYQYGSRLRSGSRSAHYPPPREDDQSGPGTERQYLFYGDFSQGTYLDAIWGGLVRGGITFDPPLSANEVAYILFPEDLTELLPENILIWTRLDGAPYVPGAGELYPFGDAGLAWTYPTEPLLPSLISLEPDHDPILGGRYPPEPAYEASSDDEGNPVPVGTKVPIDGRGLCSMPLAQRGYLCRPLRVTDENQCPEPEETPEEENVITLVSCTVEEQPTLTVAGPDVCREIEYLNKEEGAPAHNCDVRFRPGPCPGGDPGSAGEKQADGSISLCLDDSMDGPPLTYVQEHELVHAQQYCQLPAGDIYAGLHEEEGDALCCRLEGEAHFVNCKRMIEDGVLNNAFVQGIEVTAQTCMEMMRVLTCSNYRGRDVSCGSTVPFTRANGQELFGIMSAGGNPADLPDTYDEATDPDTMDARVAARVRAIERQVPVCTPGTESEYKNTIGNNACYIGQCVEESLELHRLTGGRSPATVGDGAFPHDDPRMGTALATVLRSVPATSPPLPSYRPQMITRILEDALCQLQGLPAATPPHLCAFSPSRRLAVPLADGSATARSLQYNSAEQRDAATLVEGLAAGLGSRIGTDIQGQYLRIGTRTLSEVVALANMLLKETLTVTFPTNMCPLSIDA